MTADRAAQSRAGDRIRLLGVQATGHHGVFEHERRDGQLFVVDVELELDLRRAGRTDALTDTVSYAQVAADVVARIQGPPVDLIERLAELIAADTLARPLVTAVEVTVHKPQAPVGVPFGDVQVVLRRERGIPVVIALGGNLGIPVDTLAAAVTALADVPGLTLTGVSPLVESDPVGGPAGQAAYLNAVVLARYAGAPARLLRRLHAIEHAHGRRRELRWGPRTLDLDLVQMGTPGTADEVLSDRAELTLPHPRAAERAFVLVPWAQLDPAATVRVGGTVADPVLPIDAALAAVDRAGVRPGPAWPAPPDLPADRSAPGDRPW